jgi:hypothetical protein
VHFLSTKLDEISNKLPKGGEQGSQEVQYLQEEETAVYSKQVPEVRASSHEGDLVDYE